MKSLRFLVMFTILTLSGTAWGQASWGGSDYQDPDSMDATYIVSTNPTLNFGASGLWVVRELTQIKHSLVRFKNDPHDGGKTQDSAKLHLFYSGGVPYEADDTMMIYFYVMKMDWVEGTQVGAYVTEEVSWDSTGIVATAWTTPGALGDGTDRNATPCCSLEIEGLQTPGDEYVVKIDGAHLTSEFFDYGIGAYPEWSIGSWDDLRFDSDNSGTAIERLYIEGWQSTSGAAETIAGSAVAGGLVVGSSAP